MYRVVVVDDEEPVLDSFSFILDKEKGDFALCGKARSGTEAIRVIRELKPDMVFMDIQMPGMDGIGAIAQIRMQYPDIVFILATAYERFDIAQKAIPLGVFSYMVKPISRKSLINELHRVKLHLDRARQGTSLPLEDIHLFEKAKEEMKDRLLSNLAWESPSSEDWETLSRLFSLKCERGSILLAEVRCDAPWETRDAMFKRLKERIQFKFTSLQTTIAERLLFFFPEDQNLDGLDLCIREAVAYFRPLVVATGRGGVYHYTQLSTSFAEAYQSAGESGGKRKPQASDRESVQRICSALLRQDFQHGLPLFEEYWIREFRNNDFEVAKAKMTALFTLLSHGIDNPSAGDFDFNPAEAIMPLRSIEEWRRWSSEALARLQTLLGKHEWRALPKHLTKALSTIRERYNQPIQLSSIADECQITGSYLCRLFSEYLGMSFVEYLNRYRIEQAMVLLRDGNLSIKEASTTVGYQDPNYFSRVFRRYMGLTPSHLVNRRKRNES